MQVTKRKITLVTEMCESAHDISRTTIISYFNKEGIVFDSVTIDLMQEKTGMEMFVLHVYSVNPDDQPVDDETWTKNGEEEAAKAEKEIIQQVLTRYQSFTL